MKRFSFILMVSALAVLLAVDVRYFCGNSAVLSQLNASSSSGESSSGESSSGESSSSSSSSDPFDPNSSSSYSSSASASDPGLAPLVRFLWRAANYYAVYYTVKDGIEKEIRKEKKGYSAWVATTYEKSRTEYPDGRVVIVYGKKRECNKFDGDQEGNCSPVGTSEFLN